MKGVFAWRTRRFIRRQQCVHLQIVFDDPVEVGDGPKVADVVFEAFYFSAVKRCFHISTSIMNHARENPRFQSWDERAKKVKDGKIFVFITR